MHTQIVLGLIIRLLSWMDMKWNLYKCAAYQYLNVLIAAHVIVNWVFVTAPLVLPVKFVKE